MKVYSIGREIGCDIVIDDPSNVISRRHATLNVMSFGKMTIVDSSQNGTYVNGIRITSNAPVPVTRKDNVSFAHIAQLDWSLVSNPKNNILKYVVLAVLAIGLVVGGVFWFNGLNNDGSEQQSPNSIVVTDSINKDSINKVKVQQAEQERIEAIKKHVQDSIEKAKKIKDTKKIEKKEKKAELDENTKENDNNKEGNKEEAQKKKRFS